MASPTGARIIARSLRDLGVTVIFGIVGIPVVEIAEEAINLGIRFIGFRNEQAAGYAASAYGYLTGRPGVCLVVGGPGVLHAVAGIGNANVNAFPLLLLAGSSETNLVSRGAFQELDAISLLTPHTKLALRPPTLESIPDIIQNTYRTAWYGRPGTGFVDLPADLIQGVVEDAADVAETAPVPDPPKGGVDEARLFKVTQLIKSAKAPLVVIGKGAAYAKAEGVIRDLIDKTNLPFLPTPMGKGVVADSHPANTASARSTALKEADVVLILGARLNWILHFGDAPKWNPAAQFIQVDISAEEIGKNAGNPELGIIGDINIVASQLASALGTWSYQSNPSSPSPYLLHLSAAKSKNAAAAAAKASVSKTPLTFAHALTTIRDTLHALSPPDEGGIVYVSEGANTMDQSRSIFPVSHPRLRLDAGTYATMGVGLGYAIAAHEAYNNDPFDIAGAEEDGQSGPPSPSASSSPQQKRKKKKIVCLEGDSALGFSLPELETIARHALPILIFVLNNSGIYHGDADSAPAWRKLQHDTVHNIQNARGLRSTSLGWEVGYEKMCEAVGGMGFLVRTGGELERAVRAGWAAERVCVVNVIVEAGAGGELEFGWQGGGGGGKKKRGSRL